MVPAMARGLISSFLPSSLSSASFAEKLSARMPSHSASNSAAEPRMIFVFKNGNRSPSGMSYLPEDRDLGVGFSAFANGHGKGVR